MRSIYAAVLILAIAVGSLFAGNIQKGIDYYIYSASSGGDSTMQTRQGLDTLLDSLATDGVLIYDLGRCPSNPADSGCLGIVEYGAASVGCSLFVLMTQDLRRMYDPNFLKLVSYDANIITDSCNATGNGAGTAHIYAMPSMRAKTGYRMILKLYEYSSGASAGGIIKVFTSRQAQ